MTQTIKEQLDPIFRPRSVAVVGASNNPDRWGHGTMYTILNRSQFRGEVYPINPKDDVAAIVYTGGTTGLPKGVLLTHYNLIANAMQNAAWFDWNRNDIIIGLLPFYHSWGGCTCVNSPILCGARVIIIPRFDAAELLSTIQNEKATVLYGAASMFTTLVNSPELGQYDASSS